MRPERGLSHLTQQGSGVQSPAMTCRVIIPASETAVRRGLQTVKSHFAPTSVSEDTLGQIELVLAEILNNIVEHAYAGIDDGEIELLLVLSQGDLSCTVTDRGKEMPNGTPPMGHVVDPDCPIEDLPEGGFGWFLIRELTQELCYQRRQDQNVLNFHMALDGPED